ncbi:ferritin-like domain-containing protein [Mucilaginibacter sp. UR6-1]|uniref:ferritin-like domain-containing protein n=1 Tax=Mucilaginibacter sp. UR6-1 TaxID=1435643 RepID=UPI001E3C64E2|nr:ferritin-like domain-containing protein [Mucilaginibacter sp. UR6-1]MCC8407534.1 ferritin-like domain-containing protein [Mucilaginibacter sp. UR6-1]
MKTETQNLNNANMARRAFLRYAGASTAVAGIVAMQACSKDNSAYEDDGSNSSGAIDVGSGDPGILNYAYALEQLEAAFYIQVVNSFSADFSAEERLLLTDIRDHEVAHREFFKAALGSGAIKGLTPDFSKIDFSSRASVLNTAKAFEDLGVAAYDGVASKIQNVDYLVIAGKIVSVEARHAAVISNLRSTGSFVDSDQVDADGLNITLGPTKVVATANTFLKTKISAKSFNF